MPRIPQVLYCLVAACALFACGCGSDGEKQRTVVRLDENHFLGEPVAVSNLTVWPVFADSVQEIGPFLTLKEAEEKQLAAVRENPAGGDVGTLVIENTGDIPVLVLAGTVVTGGKQDRQIGQDFVVQAGSTVPVDAFCVERGRWSAQRKGEATNGKFKVAGVVATAPVRGAGQHEKNQGKVWDSVEEICVIFSETIRPSQTILGANLWLSRNMTAEDPNALPFALVGAQVTTRITGTSLAAVLEDTPEEARKSWQDAATEVREYFADPEMAAHLVGFAYAVNGEPLGVRVFAHPRIFEAQFGALLETICLEADVALREAALAAFAAARADGPEATITTRPASFNDVRNSGLIAVRGGAGGDAELIVGTQTEESHMETEYARINDIFFNPESAATRADSVEGGISGWWSGVATQLRAAAAQAVLVERARTIDGTVVADLVRQINAADEELVETSAGNSNGYRKNEHGYNANCYYSVPPTGGGGGAHRVVALSRDWMAKPSVR